MDINDIDPTDLIDFANAWRDLGHAVQEQAEEAISDPDADVNHNAIRLAADRLRSWPVIAQPLREWLSENG